MIKIYKKTINVLFILRKIGGGWFFIDICISSGSRNFIIIIYLWLWFHWARNIWIFNCVIRGIFPCAWNFVITINIMSVLFIIRCDCKSFFFNNFWFYIIISWSWIFIVDFKYLLFFFFFNSNLLFILIYLHSGVVLLNSTFW